MTKPVTLLLIVTTLALVSTGCAGLLCIACDGHLGVTGYVYRALPAEPSAIAVDADAVPELLDPAPIESRGVHLINAADKRRL